MEVAFEYLKKNKCICRIIIFIFLRMSSLILEITDFSACVILGNTLIIWTNIILTE